MTDRDALLAGVLAAPADDLPRLVYADYLEEHGPADADRARAEFIRLQVAAYRDPRPEADERGRAADRAKELLNRHRDDWLAWLPDEYRDAVGFARGFPDTLLVCDGRAARVLVGRPGAAELLAADCLDLTGVDADPSLTPADLAGPGLARVRRLRFNGFWHSWRLLAGPDWGGVEDLDLLAVTDPHPLAAWAFGRVRRLSVAVGGGAAWPRLGAEAFPAVDDLTVRFLTGSSNPPPPAPDGPPGVWSFSGLGRLAWDGAPLTAGAALGLADGSAAPDLTELSLAWRWDAVTPGEFAAALDRPGLRYLFLGLTGYPWRGGPDAAGAAALAANPRLAGLHTLALSGPRAVTAAAAVALLESPHLRNLRRLSVAVRGDSYPLRRHLLAAPLDRFEKLHFGPVSLPPAVLDRLGPRLEHTPDTPDTLARLRRTRPDV